jgi:hypothetical protein
VAVLNKTFKMPKVKSLNTNYIVVLISVLYPDINKLSEQCICWLIAHTHTHIYIYIQYIYIYIYN